MKRILISLLLFVTAIGGAVGELLYIGSQSDSFTSRIEEVDRLVRKNDFAGAQRLCRSVSADWDETADKVYIFLIHDYIDNIGLSIAQMQSHIENVNPDMYFAESANAKRGLKSLKASEFPDYENIL